MLAYSVILILIMLITNNQVIMQFLTHLRSNMKQVLLKILPSRESGGEGR